MPILGCTGGGGDGGGGGGRGESTDTEVVHTAFDELPASENSELGEFKLGHRWRKASLTYFIASFTTDLDQATQRQIIAQAFQAWSAVTPLNFSEVNSAGDADLVLGFGTGDHCALYQAVGEACPRKPFDTGPSNMLAHCYYPPQGGDTLVGGPHFTGDCHFDDAERWGVGTTTDRRVIRLLETAIHEIGHGLGLDHSDTQGAIMFASYDSDQPKVQLRQDDVAGIQALYGARDRSVPSPQPPQDPPRPLQGVPTNPGAPQPGVDTDGDGIDDVTEVFVLGTDPRDIDTDKDGLTDLEAAFGLNPRNPDTDGDGVEDGQELRDGSNPFIPDRGTGGNVAPLVQPHPKGDTISCGLLHGGLCHDFGHRFGCMIDKQCSACPVFGQILTLVFFYLILHSIVALMLAGRKVFAVHKLGSQTLYDIVKRTIEGWVTTYRTDLEADLAGLRKPLDELQAILIAPINMSRSTSQGRQREPLTLEAPEPPPVVLDNAAEKLQTAVKANLPSQQKPEPAGLSVTERFRQAMQRHAIRNSEK